MRVSKYKRSLTRRLIKDILAVTMLAFFLISLVLGAVLAIATLGKLFPQREHHTTGYGPTGLGETIQLLFYEAIPKFVI